MKSIDEESPKDNQSEMSFMIEDELVKSTVGEMVKMGIIVPYDPHCPSTQLHHLGSESQPLDGMPSTLDILSSIPSRDNIKELNYIHGLFPFSSLKDIIESNLYQNIRELIVSYYNFVLYQPDTVLQGLIKAAPIVIGAHRNAADFTIKSIYKNVKELERLLPREYLWKLPYKTIRYLYENSSKNNTDPYADKKKAVLQLVDRFRSSNYNLKPYFWIELQFLKTVAPDLFDIAEAIINRAVTDRFKINPKNKGVRTEIPTQYIKLMPLLTRKLFSDLQPCTNLNLYMTCQTHNRNYLNSPLVSLYTKNGEALSRNHGEIYDAICTLWSAGNNIISDNMIARTIWPKASHHGSERFSSKELITINQVIDDLRQARVKIDATNELMHYKKIGKEDTWTLEGNILTCADVYTRINGSKYIQRAYRILTPPILLTYASELGQVLSAPLSVLETHDRTPHTFKCTRIRSYLLERIHHFLSPSFYNKEKTILIEKLYEIYNQDENITPDMDKKAKCIARNAAKSFLESFKQNNLILDYEILKLNGKYKKIQIYTP